jgi:hypothetical protein
MSTSQPTPPLSFDRAQFANDPPPRDACAFCQRLLTGDYFRVGTHLACSTCAANAQALTPPDSHKAFSRAMLFGVIAAAFACAIYALLQINLPFNIGYFAVGVGWVIGRAMKQGAQHHGGRRYQIAAAILTYMAITVAFVPVAYHAMSEHKATTTATQTSTSPNADTGKNAAATNPKTPAKSGFGTVLLALLMLLGIGLISPVLILFSSPFHGLINLVIIAVGVRFAWQFTASPRVDVQGPFTTT